MKFIFYFLGLAAMASAQDLKVINDAFTAKMFQEVAAENPGKNIILSAFSVLPPLAQLSLASDGESHDELLKAIGLPNDDTTVAVFRDSVKQLHNIQGVTLNIANRIYIAADASLNPQFAALSKDVFESELQNIDFKQSQSAVKEINSWVEDHTNHKIKDLLQDRDVDGSTRAVLVNAIYFNGTWEKSFEKSRTTDKDFHLGNGQTRKVPMMVANDDFLYGESNELDAKLLEMKYKGGEASFLVVLPNQMDGIGKLLEALKNPSLLETAVANMNKEKVDVMLPKFKIETSTNLIKVLEKLNVNKLFKPSEAKLNKLLEHESNLHISSAIQKAFIEVKEEGTEAAAANAFSSSRSAKVLPPSKKFVADHPFYFALKYKYNTLFTGNYLS